MFEPIRGSAFDIAAKGIANPVATFWTACQMLEHQGEHDAAMRLMKTIEIVCAAATVTPDVDGNATTRMVTDAVIEAFREANV
jgi:tartrate dehydrogenase/decarboxylase / D-malate dehydrogenase